MDGEAVTGNGGGGAAGGGGGTATNATCTICFNAQNNSTHLDACTHTFCYSCIRRWCTDYNTSCPQCREPIGALRPSTGAMEIVKPLGETPLEAEQTETLRRFRVREDAERERWRQEQESGIIDGEVTRPSSVLSREGRAMGRDSRCQHQHSGEASDADDSDEGGSAGSAMPRAPQFGFTAKASPVLQNPVSLAAATQTPQDLQIAILQNVTTPKPAMLQEMDPKRSPATNPTASAATHPLPSPPQPPVFLPPASPRSGGSTSGAGGELGGGSHDPFAQHRGGDDGSGDEDAGGVGRLEEKGNWGGDGVFCGESVLDFADGLLCDDMVDERGRTNSPRNAENEMQPPGEESGAGPVSVPLEGSAAAVDGPPSDLVAASVTGAEFPDGSTDSIMAQRDTTDDARKLAEAQISTYKRLRAIFGPICAQDRS